MQKSIATRISGRFVTRVVSHDAISRATQYEIFCKIHYATRNITDAGIRDATYDSAADAVASTYERLRK